jgi:hypothetical protein
VPPTRPRPFHHRLTAPVPTRPPGPGVPPERGRGCHPPPGVSGGEPVPLRHQRQVGFPLPHLRLQAAVSRIAHVGWVGHHHVEPFPPGPPREVTFQELQTRGPGASPRRVLPCQLQGVPRASPWPLPSEGSLLPGRGRWPRFPSRRPERSALPPPLPHPGEDRLHELLRLRPGNERPLIHSEFQFPEGGPAQNVLEGRRSARPGGGA